MARACSACIKRIASFFAPIVALPLLTTLAAQSEARAAEEQASPSYRVEVGAFHTEFGARALCDPLIQQGHPVAVAAESAGSIPLFVCRSARTYDRAGAQAIAEGIHKERRYEPIVVAVSSASTNRRLSKPAERSAGPAIAPELRHDFERFMEEQERDPSRAARPGERSGAPAIAPELRNEFERFMEEQGKGTPRAGG